MLGVRALLQRKALAFLVALVLSAVAATTVTATAAQAQAQDDEQSQRTDEQGFDKWGQLLGLAGLAGAAGLALQRTDKKNDDDQ